MGAGTEAPLATPTPLILRAAALAATWRPGEVGWGSPADPEEHGCVYEAVGHNLCRPARMLSDLSRPQGGLGRAGRGVAAGI